MENSIIQRLRQKIGQCPYLDGLSQGVWVDYTNEKAPNYGVFPGGETFLEADLKGNERWEYAFSLQIVGYSGEESERENNEAFSEKFSRWAGEITAQGMDLGDCGTFESLWAGQGSFLYPAQDGQTFVYQILGRLRYWRTGQDRETIRRRWLFAFGSQENPCWTEIGEGICSAVEQIQGQGDTLYDFSGKGYGGDNAISTRQTEFIGWLRSADPFQKEALARGREEEVQWAMYVGKSQVQDVPAWMGNCALYTEQTFSGQETEGKIRIRMEEKSRQNGSFWREENAVYLFSSDSNTKEVK